MAFSILIIDCTDKPYNSANHGELALGGIERTVVQLAQTFVRKGLGVTVWNNTPAPVAHAGVTWVPKSRPDLLTHYDIVIACNDPCLFDDYAKASGHTGFKPYLWFHNRVLLEKTIRKGRMIPMLRWRPVGVFLGKNHEAAATKFIPLRQRTIIGHGIEQEILNYTPPADGARPPVAVFFSQAYRGLSEIVSLWIEKIHPALPEARLRIYASNLKSLSQSEDELTATGIDIRGRLLRQQLMEDLESARVCLIPGHPDETFCLAAAEALAMHIPVLTYGTGALKERVADGQNGFVVSGSDEFARRLKQILTDDALWHKLSSCNIRQNNWEEAAEKWLRLFGENA
jgi:glycosyltransferase involved in cell wall biosynthesis